MSAKLMALAIGSQTIALSAYGASKASEHKFMREFIPKRAK